MDPSSNLKRTEHLHGLDVMRMVAALVVLFFHIQGNISGYDDYPAGDGYLAVDAFFVLSGYVIARAYDDRLSTGLRPLEFMIRRVIRLYPLYALGFFLGSLALWISVLIGQSDRWNSVDLTISLIPQMFFLPGPPKYHPQLYPSNYPAWSLFFEMIINVVYALGAWRLSKAGLISVIALAAIALVFSTSEFNSLDYGSAWVGWYVGLARVTFSFFVGVFLSRHCSTPRNLSGISLVVICIALVGILRFHVSADRKMYDLLMIFLLMPTLVFLGSLVTIKTRAIISVSDLLGRWSYSLYAIHMPIIIVAIVGMRRVFGQRYAMNDQIVGLLLLFSVIILMFIADRYYDVPVRAALNKRFTKLKRNRPIGPHEVVQE